MNLQEIWKATLPSTENLPSINGMENLDFKGLKNPLMQVKKRLKQSIIWSAVFALFYIPILLYFRVWQIQLFIGIPFLSTVWAGYSTYLFYQSFESNVSANNLLSELKRVLSIIKRLITEQSKIWIFIYPFSVIGGYILGGILRTGKTIEQLFERPIMIYVLIISVLIVSPLCYYLSKYMFKMAFGKILLQMEKLIKELTEINS